MPDEVTSTDQEFHQRFNDALIAGVPEIYANGFVSAQGLADVAVAFERNGRPVAVLNISFTVAKTLAIALGTVISKLEEQTGREMLTTNDIQKIFSENGPAE